MSQLKKDFFLHSQYFCNRSTKGQKDDQNDVATKRNTTVRVTYVAMVPCMRFTARNHTTSFVVANKYTIAVNRSVV